MEDLDDSPQIHQATFERSTSSERVASLAEDQASMTIDFLRARLLSERSVSKAARQRAQQLTKKVAELEQRMEVEMQLRKKLDEARWEVLSRHKAELGEEFGHLFTNVEDGAGKERQDLNLCLEEGSQVRSEPEKSDSNEGSEGTKIGQGGQDGDDDGDGDRSLEEDMDRLAREKGSLSWASRRGHKRLQDKKWARSFRQSSRSFSPLSFGARSPDSESPHRRSVGKSVRQIRTRTANLDFEGNEEVKQDPAKYIPQSDEEKDAEVEKALEQQTELIEKFEAEENAQRVWEEKYRERYPSKEHSGDQDGSLSRRDKEVLFKSAEDDIQGKLDPTVVKGVGVGPSQEHGRGPVGEPFVGFLGGQEDQTTMVGKVKPEEGNESAQALVLHGSGTCEEGAMKAENLKVSMGGIAMEVCCDSKSHTPEAKISPTHLMKPAVHICEEVLDNQREHLHSNLASVCAHADSRDVPSSSKVNGSSIASSQGSNSGALDDASYQRQASYPIHANHQEPFYSIHTNNQEQFGGMSGESSERPMNRNYSRESFGQSPSITSDNDKAMKVEIDKDMTPRPSFGSPAKSNGSAKSLMNSSWDEIFKRKIKAQEAGQVAEQARDRNSDSPQRPHSKRPFSHWFDPSFTGALYNDHSVAFSRGAHEERRQHQRMYRKSVDTGLDRVMDVLRALEIAKHHVVEGSNEHVMEPYGYPPLNYTPHGTYFPSLPTRGMDPYLYEMENMRARMAMGYAPSPSRHPINMQHASMRGDPMVQQNVLSSLRRSYAHPTYADHWRG